MAYNIITAKSIERLIEKVNILYRLGWITQGGVSYSSKEKIYMQAMFELNTMDNTVYDDEKKEADEIVIADVPLAFEGWFSKEWEPEFWDIVKNEFSKDAALLIYRSRILTIKELLSKIKNVWFQHEAGKQVMSELQGFIEKYQWKEEDE